MSGVKQRILKGISNSGLQDWAFMVDEYDGIVDYERLTDEDIEELATYILDEIIKQPQLNENQQIVLGYLKEMTIEGVSPMRAIEFLKYELKPNEYGGFQASTVGEAFYELDNKEEAQVLQVFGKWAEKQEEE